MPKAIDRLTRSDDGYAPMGSDGQQVLAISSDGQLGPGGDGRGYTGHEHLDELGFVHMNGRIYDPLLGRFLSPDPHIQAEDLLQNYNRYSYVLNNPLRYTDPSGEFIVEMVVFVVGAALASSNNKHLKMIGTVMMMAALGPGVTAEAGLLQMAAGAETLLPAVVSFGSAAIANTIAYGPEAGIKAGLFAAAFTGAGGISASLSPELVIAHALLGCAQQASSGGQCGPGAAAAAFGKIATGLTGGIESGLAQFAITTVVGGTASVIGGGKFANGAAQAGFGYLFNHMSQAARARLIAAGGFLGGTAGAVAAGACAGTTAGACGFGAGAIVGAGVAAGAATGGFIANVVDWASNLINSSGAPQTPDQQALGEVVREQTRGGRVPLTNGQADTVLDWARETGVSGARDNRGATHWRPNGTPVPHIHVPGSGVRHIPVDVTKP